MDIATWRWTPSAGWSAPVAGPVAANAQLVLSFGPATAPPPSWFDALRAAAPRARHVYCSGGGQIAEATVDDEVVVVTAVHFASTTVHPVLLEGVTTAGSAACGHALGEQLRDLAGLRHVLLFAEGLSFNAAAFLEALNAELPAGVGVSGGLASNGLALSACAVGLDAPPAQGQLVAVGLAGEQLAVGTGSVGGWDFFGPERTVTRAGVAEVFELDGEPALDVYKRFLGDFAAELPGSALLFPLAVRTIPDGPVAVRTILSIDEGSGSMRFAGDIPHGSTVRLMRTTTDRLIDGAGAAAALARQGVETGAPVLALCVSCIGRRAVMRSRVEEELEEVAHALAEATVVGFYSNGEVAPPSDGREHQRAVLHNQTMTVTAFTERAPA